MFVWNQQQTEGKQVFAYERKSKRQQLCVHEISQTQKENKCVVWNQQNSLGKQLCLNEIKKWRNKCNKEDKVEITQID